MTAATEKLAAAITEVIGDRCPDFECTCIGCQTWAAFDEVRAIRADVLAEVKAALHGAAGCLDLAFGSPHKNALLAALARLEKEVG